MKIQKTLMQAGATFALSLFAASVMAAVSADEAAKLGTTLTPIGAEKAGNADGSIPEWTGGLATNAAAVSEASWEKSDTVIVANGDVFADSLSIKILQTRLVKGGLSYVKK